MAVDTVVYRIRLGIHNCCYMKLKGIDRLNTFDYYLWLRVLLHISVDVERNLGPKCDLSDFHRSDSSESSFPDSMLNKSEIV